MCASELRGTLFEKSSYTSTFISDSATEKSSEIHAKAGIITIIIQSKYFSVSDWPRLNLHNQLIKTGRRFDTGTNDARCVEYGQKKGRETEKPLRTRAAAQLFW